MKQNWELRNKPILTQPTNFWEEWQGYTKRKIISNKWYWKNWIYTGKRIKLDLYLVPHIKIVFKCFKGLNVIHGTVKLLEENRGKAPLYLYWLCLFFNMTPKSTATKAKINKWGFIKLKGFCTSKEKWNEEAKTTEWENINIYLMGR